MSENIKKQAVVIELNTEFVTAEMAPTTEQYQAGSDSCSARALKGIGLDDKAQLKTTIATLQGELAEAADLVRSKRARLKKQQELLINDLDDIGNRENNVGNLVKLAGRAVASCAEVAAVVQQTKSGTDMLYSRANELRYRLGILNQSEGALGVQEDHIRQTISALDRLNLSLEYT